MPHIDTIYARKIVIREKAAESQTFAISIPKTWEKVYPLVDSTGDKIAWDVYICDNEHADSTLDSKLMKAQWRHCLIISDLDGKRMRLLISRKTNYSGRVRAGIFFDDSIKAVRWLPDGEHLGFIDDEDIFTIPALIFEEK